MGPVASMSEPAKTAARAALVALALAIPFIGVRLDDINGRNGLAFHPGGVAIVVAVVFCGRLAMELWSARRPLNVKVPRPPKPRHVALVLGVILVLAVVVPITPLATRYALDLTTPSSSTSCSAWG